MEPSEKQGKTAALKALKQYPRGHAMAAGVLLGCLCLAVIALPSQEAAASRQSLDVELPLASSPLVMESDHPFALTMPDVGTQSARILGRRAAFNPRDLHYSVRR